jgi:single-strand DNA-binding protein
MPAHNHVTLMGRLVDDPTLYSKIISATRFSLAVAKTVKNEKGEWEEKADFFDCIIFGTQAENLHKYFKKGYPILIEGKLSHEEKNYQDGRKVDKIEIHVSSFTFLPSLPKTSTVETVEEIIDTNEEDNI